MNSRVCNTNYRSQAATCESQESIDLSGLMVSSWVRLYGFLTIDLALIQHRHIGDSQKNIIKILQNMLELQRNRLLLDTVGSATTPANTNYFLRDAN